ncbi:MAG TPA: phosphotransferase [Syntrophorhabdaceae bacterium]|nr:phosphotransferase [Syntrophorhabdaceae bacterium]
MNELEAEVIAALESAGTRVKSVTQISQLHPSEKKRATYRVDHESGTVKARVMQDEQAAQESISHRYELWDAFAPVIARYGRVLVEEWIDGTALPDIPDRVRLDEAGAILAEMHAASILSHSGSPKVRTTVEHRVLTEGRIRILVEAGALEQEIAARVREVLQRLETLQTTYALTHLDFCGENMIIDRTGRLRVIDNEHIRVDAIGYDLGRTWYRWALPAREWDYFYAAYADRATLPSSQESLHFWKIVAAVTSAELRIRAYPEKANVPLECLRRLAAVEIE